LFFLSILSQFHSFNLVFTPDFGAQKADRFAATLAQIFGKANFDLLWRDMFSQIQPMGVGAFLRIISGAKRVAGELFKRQVYDRSANKKMGHFFRRFYVCCSNGLADQNRMIQRRLELLCADPHAVLNQFIDHRDTPIRNRS